MEVSLDGKYIFKGEIARACGGMQGGTEAFGDVRFIVVTMTPHNAQLVCCIVSLSSRQYSLRHLMRSWTRCRGMTVSTREATSPTNGRMTSHWTLGHLQLIKDRAYVSLFIL